MTSPEWGNTSAEWAAQTDINRLCRGAERWLERNRDLIGETELMRNGLEVVEVSDVGYSRSIDIEGERIRIELPEVHAILRIGEGISISFTPRHYERDENKAFGLHRVDDCCQFEITTDPTVSPVREESFQFGAGDTALSWRQDHLVDDRSLEEIVTGVGGWGDDSGDIYTHLPEPITMQQCAALQSIVDNLDSLVY